MNILTKTLKDISLSVLPITILVIILSFTLVPVEFEMLARFIIGAILVIIGLVIFLLGTHIGVTPVGSLMGGSIAKTNKFYYVVLLGFILGFFINVAEPDIQILAKQINVATGGAISGPLILIIVSIGVGLMVAYGLIRILLEIPLNKSFTAIYSLILILGIMVSEEFLAFSVDASGATTGAMTTPFILALGLGVSQLKGGEKFEEDSFGLVGFASTGPIIALMLLNIVKGKLGIQGHVEAFQNHTGIIGPYLEIIPKTLIDSVLTLAPLLILFLLFNYFSFKLNKANRNRILKGLLYTYIGLSLFMVGVNAGFMEVGREMGYGIATLEAKWILPAIGFFLGMSVVLAEPAVYVLTEQVEEVTSGHIKRKVILMTLSVGIAFAVALSMLRIMIPGLKLWHFLLPGFGLGMLLSYFVPPIFVGIAYDSGGVASGPMTATFVLAFAQGAANAIPTANILTDGFGIIAMIAMTPLVAVQILGLIYRLKTERREIS
ncbi:MAG TPA: DUF1538 domain-containing protein [Clostridia bacterium]|nr:DUF1538 domain-containing protein [Clostridia bacterium]